MQIRWTELALDDLEAIQAYISKDSVFYAKQFIERLFETVNKLKDFPELGRRVPEAEERKDVRELIFQGYRIIYLTQTRNISIITVIHGSRNLSDTEKKPWNNDQWAYLYITKVSWFMKRTFYQPLQRAAPDEQHDVWQLFLDIKDRSQDLIPKNKIAS